MPHKMSIRLDVTKDTVEALSIGDSFEAKIKGRITELEGERRFEGLTMPGGKKGKEEVSPPNVSVDVSEVKVSTPNKFSALLDDDDEDD